MIKSQKNRIHNEPQIHQYVHEIRFHGRGGQGAVSAAALLAMAAFDAGHETQAFPRFGSERRGAPVEAYVRISNFPIRAHNQVYTPDVVVIQDSTLMRAEPVLAGLVPKGLIILNTIDTHKPPPPSHTSDQYRWVCLPANQISETHLGRPLPNTVLLGALAAATGWDILASLESAIEDHLARKGKHLTMANIAALREGYDYISQQRQPSEIAP